MHRRRAPFRALDTFFAVRSWAGCITNMSGFDFRQAQAPVSRPSMHRLLRAAADDDDGTFAKRAADAVGGCGGDFVAAFAELGDEVEAEAEVPFQV
jgi:hypothetical protein